MSDSPLAVWSVFVSGVLAAVILLVAVVAVVVISQRRYLKQHRNHARRILEAQEEERAWVSREVHDDAVQRLALIGRACGESSRAIAALSEEQANRIGAIQVEAQDLSVVLRGLAHRLHPALIDRCGLCAALRSLCEELERGYGLRVNLQLPVAEAAIRASPQRALVLYRIAQEALHNVVKHAEVSEAELELSVYPEILELIVRDRGRGFEPGWQATTDGIGLIGIKERAYLAEGGVEITSQPGQGTEVRARFPTERDGAT